VRILRSTLKYGCNRDPSDPQEPVRVIDLNAGNDQLTHLQREVGGLIDIVAHNEAVAEVAGGTPIGATKAVGVYVTGEAIRGLADLEAKERGRCANFAGKAVAAGLAERTVPMAERQGRLMVEMLQTALREVDLSPEQASAFKAALARQARELQAVS
jgi:hypothetical protein